MENKAVVIVVVVVVLLAALGLLWYVAAHAPRTGAPDQTPTTATTSQSTTGQPLSPEQAAQTAVKFYQDGLTASAAGQTDRARAIFEDVVTRFPDTWAGKRSSLELGDIYLNLGEDRKALDAFRKGQDVAGPELADSVKTAIGHLEQKLAQGASGSQDDVEYIVRPGDTLTSIAAGQNTKVEIIKLANNKPDDTIRAGQTLHISKAFPDIVVDKARFKLTLNWKAHPVRTFTVGIGKNDSTPLGEFVVDTKRPNPTWYHDGKVIPFGDPENILGTRWMGLKGTSDHTGYGIHGTTQPETVGGSTSAGCVRMLNKDVEELFEWVPIGTKVVIK